MAFHPDLSAPDADPCEILGVSPHASGEELRAAYLEKVKQYPPDKSPDEFERIRDAYHRLNDPVNRMKHLMSSLDPAAPLTDLLPSHDRVRRYLGPGPWLTALENLLKDGPKSK
jgi:curved DNA-binding protein CbpA